MSIRHRFEPHIFRWEWPTVSYCAWLSQHAINVPYIVSTVDEEHEDDPAIRPAPELAPNPAQGPGQGLQQNVPRRRARRRAHEGDSPPRRRGRPPGRRDAVPRNRRTRAELQQQEPVVDAVGQQPAQRRVLRARRQQERVVAPIQAPIAENAGKITCQSKTNIPVTGALVQDTGVK